VKRSLVAAAAATIITGAGLVSLPYFIGERVVSVIDGDSFKIKNDQTIRLSSLDAPESDWCGGPEATAALKKKITGKRVILRDVKTDRYGRILALVYLPDGTLANEYLVKNGLAQTTTEAGDENERVKAANDYARQNKLGIFGEKCSPTEPPNKKCLIKANYNYHERTKTYFLPECRHYEKVVVKKYQGDDWFCSEAEAKTAGFIKSENCK
jgi:endonuclease YncB( thermonuclease family)